MGKIGVMVAQRLALGLLTLLVVSLIIFLAVEALPGDLAEVILGQAATEETVAAIRREFGLDLPWYQRYVEWLWGMLQGDMGKSLANKREIAELIGGRLGNTLSLAALAAIISVPLAVTLGVLAALYRNSIFDRSINVITLSSISFPEFFIAYILILFLSVQLGIFPSISNVSDDLGFWDSVYRSLLPAITLTLVVVAHMMRMTRAAIINLPRQTRSRAQTLASAYIEMASLKGLRRRHIIVRHALPNALAPIINVVAINLAYLVVGVVIVEVGQRVHRNGQPEGPAAKAHHCPPRLAQRARADHQRGGYQPGLSGGRCRHRRGCIRLSRTRSVASGFGIGARLPGGAGERPDLRRGVHFAEPHRRCALDHDQPAAHASALRGQR